MAIISRAYQTEDDYTAMLRFLQNVPNVPESATNVTIGDIDWWRFHHDDVDHTRKVQLWIDEETGNTVGFTWPGSKAIDLMLDPRFREAEPEMVEWAVAYARANGDAELTIVANDLDLPRQEVLAARGFVRTEAHYTYRGRSIQGELPPPALPDGFRFGDSVGADDAYIEARVNVHRAAWEPSGITIAKHVAVMGSPTYRPELDLVVIDPNGEMATCTIVWLDPQNAIGVFEPVGCAPAFRKRGLTAALMYEGMRRLKALGATRAFVNSWWESVPANRLYESCGFELVDYQRKWTKQL